MRIVFLVAPNGSERSEARVATWRRPAFLNMREIRVRLIVQVFVNSIVCLFVFMPVLFLSDVWLGLRWLVWLVSFSGL